MGVCEVEFFLVTVLALVGFVFFQRRHARLVALRACRLHVAVLPVAFFQHTPTFLRSGCYHVPPHTSRGKEPRVHLRGISGFFHFHH